MHPNINGPLQRLIIAGFAAFLAAHSAAAEVAPRSDFDGDGFDELVVAVPGYSAGGTANAGAVIIVPGSREGVQPFSATLILHRGIPTVPGEPAAGEEWGMVIATGDFNSDGFHDLAIGSPRAAVDGQPGRGDVLVFYGSRNGLRLDNIQQLAPDAEWGEAAFGSSLTAGFLDSDPFADLAIGAPGAFAGQGAVNVYHASLVGRLVDPVMLRPPDTGAAAGSLAFGTDLAAARFAGAAGPDDLAIAATGAARLYLARPDDSGTLVVQPPEGITVDFGGSAGITALAGGDFNGDGIADLALGRPCSAADATTEQAGLVAVMDGAAGELAIAAPEIWRQDRAGFRAEIEAGDQLGGVLATGDFDGDGFADLAIGVPDEADLGLAGRGVVHVLYGTAAGFTTTKRATFNYDLNYALPTFFDVELGDSLAHDRFGAALGAGDFNGDGLEDLAIGVPGRPSIYDSPDVGMVLVLLGSTRGATTVFARVISYQTLTRLEFPPEAGARLGLALSGGNTPFLAGNSCTLD